MECWSTREGRETVQLPFLYTLEVESGAHILRVVIFGKFIPNHYRRKALNHYELRTELSSHSFKER